MKRGRATTLGSNIHTLADLAAPAVSAMHNQAESIFSRINSIPTNNELGGIRENLFLRGLQTLRENGVYITGDLKDYIEGLAKTEVVTALYQRMRGRPTDLDEWYNSVDDAAKSLEPDDDPDPGDESTSERFNRGLLRWLKRVSPGGDDPGGGDDDTGIDMPSAKVPRTSLNTPRTKTMLLLPRGDEAETLRDTIEQCSVGDLSSAQEQTMEDLQGICEAKEPGMMEKEINIPNVGPVNTNAALRFVATQLPNAALTLLGWLASPRGKAVVTTAALVTHLVIFAYNVYQNKKREQKRLAERKEDIDRRTRIHKEEDLTDARNKTDTQLRDYLKVTQAAIRESKKKITKLEQTILDAKRSLLSEGGKKASTKALAIDDYINELVLAKKNEEERQKKLMMVADSIVRNIAGIAEIRRHGGTAEELANAIEAEDYFTSSLSNQFGDFKKQFGFGISNKRKKRRTWLKKGSQEAKRYMAKLRAMRRKK